MSHSAFKEWHLIVQALGAGAQTLILRKGGIAEGRGGFAVKADRFWLFPTFFHAQLEKAKPTAQRWADPLAVRVEGEVRPPRELKIEFFAETTDALFVSDWAKIAALDGFHFWSEATVRERFDWSKPAGLHVLVVRVQKLNTPQNILVTPEMAGCKSWVDLPTAFTSAESKHVLSGEEFSLRRAAILKVLN